MQLPLKITFRDISPSPAIEAHVREKAQKLEKFHSRILGIRVTVSAPDLQHHKRATHHVQVDVKVPGSEIVVNKERRENHENEDVYVAIRDAFSSAERQLRQLSERKRDGLKTQEPRGSAFLPPEPPTEEGSYEDVPS